MKKHFISGFICGAILLGGITAFANVGYQAITATFPIIVNGQKWTTDKPVVVIDGSTYLPLKALGEALNVNVIWNSSNNQVEINKVELSNPFILKDGQYIVGEDINPGKYDLRVISGSGNLIGSVKALGIMGLNEVMAEEGSDFWGDDHYEYSNLRLNNGDSFTISGGMKIEFTQK